MVSYTSWFTKLYDRFTTKIRDAFRTAIEDITDRAILKDIVSAVEVGDINRAFQATGLSQAALRPITAMLEQAFEQGGVTTVETFPRVLNGTDGNRAVFRFDVRDSRAEAWLRENSSTLVTTIQEDTRTAIRNIIERNMKEGNNPRTTALDIVGRIDPTTGKRVGGVIGMTTQQENWVARARAELNNGDRAYFNRALRDKRFDKLIERAIREGRPLTKEEIQKIVTRYADSVLRYRGETIARTETQEALNRSQYEAIRQAVVNGHVSASAVRRVWDTAGDNRVRHSHRAMDGQKVGLEEAFTAPGGAKLMYPGDRSLGAPGRLTINCRCHTKLVVDWLSDID